MNRGALIGVVLVGGAALLAVTVAGAAPAGGQVVFLTEEQYRQFLGADGALNFNQTYKPIDAAPSAGFYGGDGTLSGLGDAPFFDWGSWGDEYEYWGAQNVEVNPQNQQAAINALPVTIDELITAVANHLKEKEGFSPVVYDDATGKPWTESRIGKATIGYGHLLKPGEPLDWVMNEFEADTLLYNDVADHLFPIIDKVTTPLSVPQWVAIASLAFNAGAAGVARSRFLKAVNKRDFENAEIEFKDWNKTTIVKPDGTREKKVVRGLTNRRNAEWAIFMTPANAVALTDSTSNYG